jgi:UDP-3-O-acyl N-acetylglucosamine deacetylase
MPQVFHRIEHASGKSAGPTPSGENRIKEGPMRKTYNRRQRTIARAAEVCGVGYLTGADVLLRFAPAPPGTGVIFVRTDLQPPLHIPARVEQITDTNRRTTLGQAPLCVSLVEHVLAALAGLHIDNCFIEVNAPEPPGLDGSATPFVRALQRAGTVVQPAERTAWVVEHPVLLADGGATIGIHPAGGQGLRISYLLDYGPRSPIMFQRATFDLTPEVFAEEIAPCRTYLLEAEAQELLRQGIGKRTRVTDLLVFGPHGPIDNRLRFADEPARHKILDVIGDLSLLGCDLCGHVLAYRSGHPHNAALARQLRQQMDAAGRMERKVA